MMRAPLGLPIPLLCYLTELVGAQTLEFLSPAANALTALGDEVRYDDGEVVEVQWRSDYDDTNLEVWQGPQDDGTFVVRSLGSESRTCVWMGTTSAADIVMQATSRRRIIASSGERLPLVARTRACLFISSCRMRKALPRSTALTSIYDKDPSQVRVRFQARLPPPRHPPLAAPPVHRPRQPPHLLQQRQRQSPVPVPIRTVPPEVTIA